MGNYTTFLMFENPRRGRQARNFTENDPKILDLKSSSGQIIFRKLSMGVPDNNYSNCKNYTNTATTTTTSTAPTTGTTQLQQLQQLHQLHQLQQLHELQQLQ